MKITELIKEHAIKLILSGIFAILGFLIGSIYSETFKTSSSTVLQAMSKTLILKMLLFVIVVCIILFALVIYFYLKTRLIPKFGVLWDKKKEPHCTNCEKPFGRYKVRLGTNAAGLYCVKCKQSLPLMTDEGERITLIKAKKLL